MVVSERFRGLAQTICKARGKPEFRMIVVPANVEEMPDVDLQALAHKVLDRVEAGQFDTPGRDSRSSLGKAPTKGSQGRLPESIEGLDSIAEVSGLFLANGWTDGLPIVPPTQEYVEAMVQGLGRRPDELVGIIGPRRGRATIEQIGINAVMAGCLPVYMPCLIAIVEALCEDDFNVDGVQGTTNPCGVAVVINGPVRHALNINSGRNCLGPGWQSNATIGRAVRLMLQNIGGGRPGEVDKATQGFPGKYTMCFAEAEEESPWEPFHVERGFSPDDSTVTIMSTSSTLNIVTATIVDPVDVFKMIAQDMGQRGSNHALMGRGEPAVLLTPGHAKMAAQKLGFSKRDLKQFLYEHSRFSAAEYPKVVRARSFVRDGYIYQAQSPDDVMVLVAGGPEPYHVTFMPTFADSKAVTKRIRPVAPPAK